ncbi:MAG: hypothetical protein ABR923_00045 [Terracidiphilus sp.]|jgi:hypothetical protein
MKSLMSRLVLAAVASLVIFAWFAHRGESIVMAEDHAPVMATRIYSGADGFTHVEQVEVRFPAVPGGSPAAAQSENLRVSNSYVARLAPGFFEDWHNADARRYVVPISGRAEIEVGGGQKVMVEPGHIYIAEDLTGKGHTFRVVGKEDWVALFVNFAK